MTRTPVPTKPDLPELPVSAVLGDIADALGQTGRAVLSAPPGAGKTTLVPLHLLQQEWRADGKIILLEPRRLAARAAAGRMAELLNEDIGDTIGYRMRLDNRISSKTRIEVVTEGVFARMVLDDPELAGVSTVIFDEFHERSLDGDFGLALALDVQGGLREDLRILVMSATLDVERISALMGSAPVIQSLGRTFPIDVRYEERWQGVPVDEKVARVIAETHASETGSILAFLPGQAEITRTAARLEGRFFDNTDIIPLYGNLSQKEQDAAIMPARAGRRKIVLATSIAETSITIDGVRVVIDSGLQRLPVFEPATGITRLETVRVSRASADQRAGRAGRTEPGVAIRLWHPGQTAALNAFTPPQILASDLAGLALDLAHWGVQDPSSLAFLDMPPEAALKESVALLKNLEALDKSGALTQRGRLMRGLSLPPRLAAMVIASAGEGAGKKAAMLAVMLTEQGLGGSDIDIDERLRRFFSDRSERAQAARKLASRLLDAVRTGTAVVEVPSETGPLLLHAYPDRIALQRGGRGRYVMANGRGAEIAETERLAASKMLVVADITGRAAQPRILAAAGIDRSDIEERMPHLIVQQEQLLFDKASGQARARKVTRLGAIILDETPLPRPDGERAARALANGIREFGMGILSFSKETLQLRDRIGFLNASIGEPWPNVGDASLLSRLDEWFVPFQHGARSLQDIRPGSLSEGILSLVPHEVARDLGRLAPTHFEAPTGQRHPIRYDASEPTLSIRVQELFGLTAHPAIAQGRLPLLLELTSPAHRPIQTTRDLPGFWAGSWKDVRADMRGRYPRHPWPEDPAAAPPTSRAKPRGT
ncbi:MULTISPECIES: ATP-dependent helicase HrpB [unclassified Agrobacterium]|uniref:ATP-dependent helicase HrpB n=1 Tax=unclassified Agrobacterium TaxID=2632611 RepID=UPI00244736F7|nr:MULTISPECIES: ATP-dependent helicase HrpB [unclassified Agrobacterium]MDH0614884.1 ATP-dependent helicase HrpB [Agrobacterium sp. GD03872]MDH0696873.1 ATP-dependent helicase HrpB [Agrobacterium sp. GD03871]MDH1062435.1 ATP-dependent helicase HrpB [Agrobacterium sp. GD03992]MDH2213820.1 ATP-dependent helicase HrpB [Agrobacterium sp. GD03643]MDH2222582.1 ATP-dependent helicase HrpB [Agrobacterium sp. GD03638]